MFGYNTITNARRHSWPLHKTQESKSNNYQHMYISTDIANEALCAMNCKCHPSEHALPFFWSLIMEMSEVINPISFSRCVSQIWEERKKYSPCMITSKQIFLALVYINGSGSNKCI